MSNQNQQIASFSGRALLGLILVVAVLAMCAGCDRSSATRDTNFDLFVYTDKATGCQYLTESRGLTPRIAADGKTHMGCKGGAR